MPRVTALIRFGTRIDLIAFKGLNASGEEIEIVFIEIKTGRSGLSAVVCQKIRRRPTSLLERTHVADGRRGALATRSS